MTGRGGREAHGPFAWVGADRWGGCGSTGFRLREDFAADLEGIAAEVRAAGGLITSSGGLRPLDAEVTPGRSPVSLHYLGRAIDLCIWSGMQGNDDPYVIVHDSPTATERIFWRVYCVIATDLGLHCTLDARMWQADGKRFTRPRDGSFLDLTECFEAGGWTRVPARPGGREHYLSVEWWHLERRDGLEVGRTTFAGELAALYPAATIAASPLAALGDRVWNGRWFAMPLDATLEPGPPAQAG